LCEVSTQAAEQGSSYKARRVAFVGFDLATVHHGTASQKVQGLDVSNLSCNEVGMASVDGGSVLQQVVNEGHQLRT